MAMVARITSGYRPSQAIEYHHAGFGHYFVTAESDEIDKLDAGAFGRLGTYRRAVRGSGARRVRNCERLPFLWAASESRARTSMRSKASNATKSSSTRTGSSKVFASLCTRADAAGSCATDMQPLFRLYNKGHGGAPNHRYTTSTVTRGQMLARDGFRRAPATAWSLRTH